MVAGTIAELQAHDLAGLPCIAVPSAQPTIIVDVDEGDPVAVAEVADRAARVLTDGGTVVVPTDTVYGLAALPTQRGAIDKLFDLKRREPDKPLAVLVTDPIQGLTLVDSEWATGSSGAAATALIDECWPGAVTLVMPRRESAFEFALGGDPHAIGVRCPASPIARAIAERVGPIATTSANVSGDPTPVTALAAAESLAGRVTVVIDAGPCSGEASTVVDATSEPFHILRQGPVDVVSVARKLGIMVTAARERFPHD